MKQKFVTFMLALLATTALFAQNKVTGTVSDDLGPAIGVSVMEKGTSNGVITDLDGNYVISVRPGATLVFSSIGYATQEIAVGTQSVINVKLSEDAEFLDEVVVIGYGTVKKSDLSGAVSQIKAEDLMKGGSLDIAHGMQGKIAGVVVQQSDGAPGGGMSIVVRGANSFTTSSQPLFIVDGIPLETASTPSNGALTSEQASNPLSFINPHDIESMEVLKDASATAIYGSRGANGVVLITTKRGRTEKPKVELNINAGVASVVKQIPVLDAYTYSLYVNEQYDNSQKYEGRSFQTYPYNGTWSYQNFADGHPNYATGKYSPAPVDFQNPGYRYDDYGNYYEIGASNWQDEIFQTAFNQDYNLSVSGGNEKGFYAFSGNYARQSGIIKNSGYERLTAKSPCEIEGLSEDGEYSVHKERQVGYTS